MINDVIDNHSGKNYTQHLIGLRMHVLADSAAHNLFSGIPAWYQNEVKDPVYQIDGSHEININFGTGIAEKTEQCSPPSFFFTSTLYLGHARVGSIADYPWLEFKYVHQWNSMSEKKYITRNNRGDFLTSFIEMYTALICIKDKKPFDIHKLKVLPDMVINAVSTAINTSHAFGLDNFSLLPDSHKGTKIRCDARKRVIDDKTYLGYAMPPEYNEDAWYNDATNAKKTHSISTTDFYYYNQSAIMHRDYGKKELIKYKVSYWDDLPIEKKHVAIYPKDAKGYLLTAEGGGGIKITATAKIESDHEIFDLTPIDDENHVFTVQARDGQYMYPSDDNSCLMANSKTIGEKEKFIITVMNEQINSFKICTYKNLYVCAESGGGGNVSENRKVASDWESFFFHVLDPLVTDKNADS